MAHLYREASLVPRPLLTVRLQRHSGWQTSSTKHRMVNSPGFEGHKVFDTTTHLANNFKVKILLERKTKTKWHYDIFKRQAGKAS